MQPTAPSFRDGPGAVWAWALIETAPGPEIGAAADAHNVMRLQETSVSQRVDSLARSFTQCFLGIDLLLERRLIQPCLVLTHSTIDAAASLTRGSPTDNVTREHFLRWVEQFLLPQGDFAFTALDLYAARCGVLHSFSAHSKLSRKGRARTIGYAWGTGKVVDLQRMIELERQSNDLVGVQLEQLVEALKRGFGAFLSQAENDPQLLSRVLNNADALFGHIPVLNAKAYLATKADA